MDVFSAEEKLSLSFINNSNEILEEAMLAGPFLHQWLESLEEQYDFSPLHISLPTLPGEKNFSSDSKTADYFEKLTSRKINPADDPECPYEILELPQALEPGFVAVHQKCAQNPILPIFIRHAPFYLKIIHRLESLSARLKLARLSLDLQNTARELNESADLPEENALSLMETFLSSSRKDHAFIYYPEQNRFLLPENTTAVFRKHRTILSTALKNAVYERSLFKNEEFHPDIRGLILYPMFSKDDLFAIFGCFSNTNPVINDFDISCVCNFCTNIANITNLANLIKK
jgi:hypothetical protein